METSVERTLDQVAEIGYAGVEFAGFFGRSAAQLRAMLDERGLKCAGTHTGLDGFMDQTVGQTIEDHQALGAQFAIVPWFPPARRDTHAACLATAADLAQAAERLRETGLQTGFHCHDTDMATLDQGMCAWDIIAQNTPADFLMQYDTGNAASGGADPVAPILRYPGRSLSVHLKEFSPTGGPAVINTGAVPWPEVFSACESVGGTRWYVVEGEVYGPYAPMELARRCFEELAVLGKV
jgi:sugar phosphate isomerase/epimerase